MKFKVGDKVQVTVAGFGLGCATVTEVLSGRYYPYRVIGPNKTFDTFKESELEFYEEPMKTFGELTPEEQGALLLAHHNGEAIEYESSAGVRYLAEHPTWCKHYKYRVKPRVEKKTFTLCVDGVEFATGTINMEDGLPDLDTLLLSTMEKPNL